MADRELYYDLETEGFSTTDHRILEIGAIAVNENLDILGTFSIVIGVKELNVSEFVRDMHLKSGLVEACAASSVTLEEAEDKLLAFVNQYYDPDDKIVLSGHSPHKVDQQFAEAHLLKFAPRLSHRVHDVGALVRSYQRHGDPSFKAGEVLGHRALDDAYGAFDEQLRLKQIWKHK